MVVIGFLDEDAADRIKRLHHSFVVAADKSEHEQGAEDAARPNPNLNKGFSAALSCYPVVRQLASQLDLNSLDSLSRTCRQFRANMLEYRDQLVKHSLCCEEEFSSNTLPPNRLTSGKVSRCARDMVGECQRCGTVVCRNCTMKPPPTPTLRARHRRLCRTCTKAPLELLTAPRRARSSSLSAVSTTAVLSTSLNAEGRAAPRAFTAPAFERTPCVCETMVWLCQTCGQHLKEADTAYVRAWSWRMRYTHCLGGVGTGAGEGNEGVECGKGADCLGAKTVEHEIEYDAETVPPLESSSPERWRGTSYFAQEIEGIGGGFKLKAKKHVRVGECVKIYKDEQDKSIQYLEREQQGKLRSWCSWCDRVVPSKAELAGDGDAKADSDGSSSSSGNAES